MFIEDCSNIIVCDYCNEDYSNSDVQGGFVYCGYSYCPVCAPSRLENIKSHNEEQYIEFTAAPNESFKDMVKRARGGNNFAFIVPFHLGDI